MTTVPDKKPVPKKRKRKNTKAVFKTPNGEIIESCYCRRCQRSISPRNFYKATDLRLDKNGYMSICKDCIVEIFKFNSKIKTRLEDAILLTCRMLNVAYHVSAIRATRTWIENKLKDGKDIDNAFGFYKSKLNGLTKVNTGLVEYFEEPIINKAEKRKDIQKEVGEENRDVVEFWGVLDSAESYDFLERELSNFKKTHKSDTHSELVLLKEVCFILLDIQNARVSSNSTAPLVKSLQDIMKTLAISPSMAKAGGAGDSAEIFGVWVKDIETKQPAEWYEDNALFRDVDNILEYCEKYITRPLKNFMTGSRDFTISSEDNDIEFSDSEYDDVED